MVPDIPGFGDSGLASEPHDCYNLAAELFASVRQIIPDDEMVAIAGFSMGSSIAVKLASSFGPQLVSLVLVGAGRGFGIASKPVAGLRSWRHLEDPSARRAAHRHNVKTLMLGPERRELELAEEIQARGNESARIRFSPESDGTELHRLLRSLPRVSAFWGEEDAVMCGHVADRIRYFQSAGVQFSFLPGAGHWVQFDRPDAANEVLLRAVPSNGSAAGSSCS